MNKKIIRAGIITIKQGQFILAIEMTIPIIDKPVIKSAYENPYIFESTASVSFDNLFNILPYGVVSKNDNLVLSKLNTILL